MKHLSKNTYLPLMMKYRTVWQHRQQPFFVHMDHRRVGTFAMVHINIQLSYQPGYIPSFARPTL